MITHANKLQKEKNIVDNCSFVSWLSHQKRNLTMNGLIYFGVLSCFMMANCAKLRPNCGIEGRRVSTILYKGMGFVRLVLKVFKVFLMKTIAVKITGWSNCDFSQQRS